MITSQASFLTAATSTNLSCPGGLTSFPFPTQMFILLTSYLSQSDLPWGEEGQQGHGLEHRSCVLLYYKLSASWKEAEGVSSVTQALGGSQPLLPHTQTETVEHVSGAQTACIAGGGSFGVFYRCFSEPVKQQLDKYRRMTHQLWVDVHAQACMHKQACELCTATWPSASRSRHSGSQSQKLWTECGVIREAWQEDGMRPRARLCPQLLGAFSAVALSRPWLYIALLTAVHMPSFWMKYQKSFQAPWKQQRSGIWKFLKMSGGNRAGVLLIVKGKRQFGRFRGRNWKVSR